MYESMHTWDLTFRRVHQHVRNVFRDRQSKNLVAHNRIVLGAISHKLYFITRGSLGEILAREKQTSHRRRASLRFDYSDCHLVRKGEDERVTGDRRKK